MGQRVELESSERMFHTWPHRWSFGSRPAALCGPIPKAPGFAGGYLLGLSNVDADRARNLQLLKERSWFDMPLVYANPRRAIIAIEKGAPGESALNEAFAAWGEDSPSASTHLRRMRPRRCRAQPPSRQHHNGRAPRRLGTRSRKRQIPLC